jgi:hypothetical protein
VQHASSQPSTAEPRRPRRAPPARDVRSIAPQVSQLEKADALPGVAHTLPERTQLAEPELGRNAHDLDAPASSREPQPTRGETPRRLPLRATDDRTPSRAVQTDAELGPPSIDGELELLGAAQTALQKQRPSRALTLLQEHAFRFPTGAMVEERMAMQALALCALQRRHAAQTVLSNLEARGSQSPLLPRVRSQCRL